MKKQSKIWKKIEMFVLAIIMMFSTTTNVFAASDTITLGAASQSPSYIAGVTFSVKQTNTGIPLYCLDIHKSTAQNIQANLVKNSKTINGGVVYILKNGYPNKTITGDKNKDYYITQTALWWYLDLTTGSQNLGEQFKGNGSDSQNLRPTIKALAYEGYNHRNDSIGVADTQLVLSVTGGNTMELKDGYYVSGDIKPSAAKNISKYTVTLNNVPSGTKVVFSNGTESVYGKAFEMSVNDSFKVKVPLAGVTGSSLQISVSAKGTGVEQYMAYEYQPVDTKMQNVALLEKSSKEVTSAVNLDIASSVVKVTKVDMNTQKAIAGAKLVLKDANGTVVTSWTSTINPHVIRNLAIGTYTIEETEAPAGYILNTNVTRFAVTDTVRDFNIIINNAPKKVVVNITKVDQATNAPLAGAVLLVRKPDGSELTRFVSTTETYVLTDLPNGTYTVEEVSAPAGYKKSDERISFTVDDAHLSHQIVFVNAREVIVPDTADFPSIIMAIIGIVITGFGLRFIYKNGQRA